MQTVHKEMVVAYSPQQMYDLVNDVSAYPTFIPFAKRAEILSQTEEAMKARLTFAFKGFEQSFVTENTLYAPKRIEVHLAEVGLFKTLRGAWQFEAVPGGTCVRLNFSFEFAHMGMVQILFQPIFLKMTQDWVGVFKKRAEEVYGR